MTKCALIVGHKKSSQGARNRDSGTTEFEFNDILAKSVAELVKNVNVEIIHRLTYKHLPKVVNSHRPDFIVSMHCNAFNTKASGSEVLYYHTSKDSKAIAEIFQKEFVNNTGVTNRGVKPKRSEDRGGYLLRETKAPCIIAEPFFIDNNAELNLIELNYDGLIRAYVHAIEKTSEYLTR